MDIYELRQFESVYKPSKEVAFCWLRKQYVQLSTEENHTEIVDHANNSLRIWQAAKAQAVPEGFVLVPREMPKSFDEGLYVYSNSISIVDECSDGFIPMSDINHAEVWKLVIEAQEPTND